MCEQQPYPVGLSCQRQSYPVSRAISVTQLRSVTEIAPKITVSSCV